MTSGCPKARGTDTGPAKPADPCVISPWINPRSAAITCRAHRCEVPAHEAEAGAEHFGRHRIGATNPARSVEQKGRQVQARQRIERAGSP